MSRLPSESRGSQTETLDAPALMSIDDSSVWPCLTILYHPDLERIGQRVLISELMAKQIVEISRNGPLFAHPGSPSSPGSSDAQPLRDPYISRSPVRLQRINTAALQITPEQGVHLYIDDSRIDKPVTVPLFALQQGITMLLSRRVVLLLHLVGNRDTEPHAGLVGNRDIAPHAGLVGHSDAIVQVRQQIARVADLDVPVLIRGETGVGKERVAQAIHAASRRAAGPCVAVNMATLAPSLAASELFGHVKGAFTGAHNSHTGLFVRAHGGTLFFDEVGETPTAVQAMLLRALQEKTIRPLGDQSERHVDVRIIAATDADIERSDNGSFRAALLFRLAGYQIRVPPLRQRRDDIPRLVVHFLRQELQGLDELARLEPHANGHELWFPPKLMLQLINHDWPGNVRQLGNAVRQLVISSRGHRAISMDTSLDRLLGATAAPADELTPPVRISPPSLRRLPSQVSNDELLAALAESRWQVRKAAQMLNLSPSSLYELIDRHPKIRKAKDVPYDELLACKHDCNGDLDQMAGSLQVSKRGLRLRMREVGLLE